jgi:phage/plasmid-associated DNA primase
MQDELSQLYESETFSKIMLLDRVSKSMSANYNRIAELVNNTTTNEGPIIYNVTNCKELPLSDPDALMTNIADMVKEDQHFLPVVEIPSCNSNFTCIIETNIKYASNEFRMDNDDVNSCLAAICKRIYKDLGVKLGTEICVFIRCYNKKVYLKLHMLRFLMNYSNKSAIIQNVGDIISKIAADNGPFRDCWLQSFNEIYETTTFPCAGCSLEHYYWRLFKIFDCKNKFGISISPIDKLEFIAKLSVVANWLNVFSINDLQSDYEKVICNRDVPDVPCNSIASKEQFQLMYLINKHPKLEFFSLVFRYLPEEYRRGVYLRDIIISLRLEGDDYYLLAKRFFLENFRNEEGLSPADTEARFHKVWNCRYKVTILGFCAFMAKRDPGFNRELGDLLERLVERFSFEECGKISEYQQAIITELKFYGKYYTYTESKGKTPTVMKYAFVDINDAFDEKMLYKWTRYENCKPINNFITGEMRDIIDRVTNKLDIASNLETRKMNKKEKSYAKIVKQLKTTKNNLGSNCKFNAIMRTLDRNIESQLFADKIDKAKCVIGVLNGVLDLNLESDDPQPQLYTGYSPYIVTRSADAEYIPYETLKCNPRYLHIIKGAFKSIFPDKESMMKFLYYISTSLDENSVKCLVFIIIGWGGNGKSLIMDWILELLGGYGQKVSPKLFTEPAQSGKADPELMQLDKTRLAYAAETSRGDSINAGRLKQVTEAKKPGRRLFGEIDPITSNPTFVISTNFELAIKDRDDGTNRRLMCLYFLYHFVHNPDPENPLEKKIDTTLPNLLVKYPKAKNELFSWLVHLRCKFHRRYRSVIDKVPSAIIDRDTNNYKCEQDTLSKFISTKLVILYGYNSSLKLCPEDDKTTEEWITVIDKYYETNEKIISHVITMEYVIRSYIEWSKRVLGEEIKGNYNTLLKDFITSGLGKLIQGEGTLANLNGVRVLEHGVPKLKGEVFISCTRRS